MGDKTARGPHFLMRPTSDCLEMRGPLSCVLLFLLLKGPSRISRQSPSDIKGGGGGGLHCARETSGYCRSDKLSLRPIGASLHCTGMLYIKRSALKPMFL
jgi:hypothetical protein